MEFELIKEYRGTIRFNAIRYNTTGRVKSRNIIKVTNSTLYLYDALSCGRTIIIQNEMTNTICFHPISVPDHTICIITNIHDKIQYMIMGTRKKWALSGLSINGKLANICGAFKRNRIFVASDIKALMDDYWTTTFPYYHPTINLAHEAGLISKVDFAPIFPEFGERS